MGKELVDPVPILGKAHEHNAIANCEWSITLLLVTYGRDEIFGDKDANTNTQPNSPTSSTTTKLDSRKPWTPVRSPATVVGGASILRILDEKETLGLLDNKHLTEPAG